MYPKKFQNLIDSFSSLPSIGPKLAERLVMFLFKQNPEMLEDFSNNLQELTHLKTCQICFNISEDATCEICKDKKRDAEKVCVVEEPLDIFPIERTKVYHGLYHVLGGVIFGGSDKSESQLKIGELTNRIAKDKIKEVIIATNLTTEGDATAYYLKTKLKPLNVKITRLARGLATGGDIEYADELTLSSALTNRTDIG